MGGLRCCWRVEVKQLPSRGRRAVFWLLLALLVATANLVLAETLIRWLVPAEIFWPVSNIYRASEFSDVGYTLRPEFRGIAFGVDLRTNSLGFRGSSWTPTPAPETTRIALVGDSHAFGFGVSFEESMGEQLASELEARWEVPFETLNFALNGYNSHQQLAIVERWVLAHRPHLLVLVVSSNDHQAARYVDRLGWLRTQENGPVRDRSLSLLQPDRLPGWFAASHLIRYLDLTWKRHRLRDSSLESRTTTPATPGREWMGPFPSGPISTRLAETVYQPLRKTIESARAQGVEIVLACFCAPLDYRQMMRDLSVRYSLPNLELLAALPGVDSWEETLARYDLGWDPHLNAQAHRHWAMALADLIGGPRARSQRSETADRGSSS